MKTPFGPSTLLDRGGQPTVRDLLSRLVFNPTDGTIRLNGDRVVMQRAAVGVELRRELIRLLGPQEARVFLIRLGFLSGQADARFVRTSWPSLDIGDAFTAGTRLHTFSGVVRVETVYNDFDFRKKRFAGEFIWHDSAEAAEFRRLGRKTTEPVCWTQLGYASGYASEFFDTLIVYKEVACSAQEHPHCRVLGKPADTWGSGDPEVVLFRERIAIPQQGSSPEPLRRASRTAKGVLTELDRLILAPVRDELDRLAPMGLPVMITGLPGTGRGRAGRYLHSVSDMSGGEVRHIFGGRVDLDICAEIARRGKSERRVAADETFLIDAAEKIPVELQPLLARSIEEGILAGGPRIVAVIGFDPTADTADPPLISSELWYALSALTIRMPRLAERKGERVAIAQALIPLLAARMGLHAPQIDPSAAEAIERADWPGNLRQMRSVLCAVLAAQRDDQPISRAQIEAQLFRSRRASAEVGRRPHSGLRALLDRMLDEGGFSLLEFERSTYEAAVDRTGGNLSAAARLLGLTRAQLAYRVGGRS